MDSFLYTLNEFFAILGLFLRAAGFLAVGLALGRFLMDAYPKGGWQVQIALVLGFFGLLIALTAYASPGSAGAYALGAGGAFLLDKGKPKTEEPKPEEKNEGRKK